MAELQTDDETVETLKKWWKDNGLAVVGGIVLGLGGVFGWRAWVDHRDQVREQASLAFEQLLISANASDLAAVETQSSVLAGRYGGTPYALLGQLALARVQVDQQDLAGAATTLRAALAQAQDPALRRLTALRLARVLVALEDWPGASAVIDQYGSGEGAFAADFAGLRGDVAAAEGRVADARKAWEQAVAGGAALARILELKLQELPPGDS